MDTENYTHLAVNKFTNLIVNGWDYSDVEPSELKEFKNDYFIVDLKDYGFNPKVYKIVTSKFAEKNGINQWSNTGVYPLEEEYKMKDEGINFSEKAYEEHPDWFYEDVSETIKRNNGNKEMKQTIKLSESELKRLVAESVKGAINELDWKTYASAAKKRAEQGASDYDVHQLDQAANKALSDKYKITGDGHFPYSPQIDTRKGESVYDTDEEGNYVKKYPHAGQTGRFPQLGYQGDFNDTYYTPIGDNVEDEPYERTTYDNFPAHKERHKDMSDYFSGKSKYVPGKGWSNESITKKINKIVSETLKRTLSEGMTPEDKWVVDEEADEDMRYEMGELNKAFQKTNDTYQATSKDGNFKTGDNVIVHTRKGDIEGVISDFDVNFMTYKETADVEYEENN